ncbi:MAG: HD domain-containing protein [Actinobacteria bacterium]|nr:MAG: HD domain-containing protein [Actinomycetota bacterium]
MAGGDDVAFNAAMAPVLMAQPGESTLHFVRHLGEGLTLRRRAELVVRALADPATTRRSLSGHCEVAARLAARLELDDEVCHSLAHAYERWDGRGYPDGLAGDGVPIAIRIVSVARDVELWERNGGWTSASDVLLRRRGHAYDPAVTDAFVGDGPEWIGGLDDDPYAAVLDAEPAPQVIVDDARLDATLSAIADFTDLKSTYFRGHSSGVASLARAAAGVAGLASGEVDAIGRAALVHDVGRVGVASGIWDRVGPLTGEQWERVRLHPYLTDRVLRRSALLAPYAGVAGGHHERADGSGYPSGAGDDRLSVGTRILAAADVFHAMSEDRPHRGPLTRPDAVAQLREEVATGRLGQTEVDAVLGAAGERTTGQLIERPAGLTEREVDVLNLIARGRSNKEAAAELGISAKTVGHHVESIYAKAGVRTRAGAALFAMERGLLHP